MGIYVQRSLDERRYDRTPLVIRGSLSRAFRSIAVFVGTGLLLVGAYLIRLVVDQPLEASQLDVLIAGVFLALASVLLVFLMEPQWRLWKARRSMKRGLPIYPAHIPGYPYAFRRERAPHTLPSTPEEEEHSEALQRRFSFSEVQADTYPGKG